MQNSNANSNDSKGIRSIWMKILTIRKGFEAFENKFELFEREEAFECKFEPFERDWNANSNYSKRIQSIWM